MVQSRNVSETQAEEMPVYSVPAVIEDVPLESYSLGCNKGGDCESTGGVATT